MEYFQFGFYKKSHDERKKWVGAGFIYEYQLIMNLNIVRDILDDKRKIFKYYKKFVLHILASLEDLISNEEIGTKLLNNPSGKIVFKSSDGKCDIGLLSS